MLLARALVKSAGAPRLWFITRNSIHAKPDDDASAWGATLWGLRRSLALEHPELQCRCIETDGDIDALCALLDGGETEPEIVLRSGERLAARLVRMRRESPVTPAQEEPWRLVPAAAGSIESFRRAPLQRRAPGDGEVEIAVEATGLNFKDVLNALDLYPGEAGPLGAECAGIVTAVGRGVTHVRAGDPVMAVIGGSFSSHVVAKAELVQRRPDGVTLAEAATFPIAFVTAEFCLAHLARLKPGDTVLIHAAAGGVGLAAIRIAQRTGARILATVGSARKRAAIEALGVTHVFDSRSDGFVEGVRQATAGKGADVVLNSLGGDLVEASFRAVADGGRFIEIGKRGIKSDAWVAALGRGIDYHIVDWGETAATSPALIGGMFATLVKDLGSGALTPLPRHEFPLDEAGAAFRTMAQARHIGRIAVMHRAEPPRLARGDGTYLVTGGLSGLGLSIAERLGEAGAGRLALIGRRGITPEAEPVLEKLRGRRVVVVAEALDVTDERALGDFVARLRVDGPPLRGVLHAAGQLDNAAVVQQTPAKFTHVLAPKISGADLLDTVTSGDPLDWFVLFSSVAGVLGAAGQSNHAAACAALDQIAWRRRAGGRHALSIDWGAWSDVGAAADLIEEMQRSGLGAVTPAQGFAAFAALVIRDKTQSIVLPIDWAIYRARAGAGGRNPFLSELASPAPAAAKAAAPAQAGSFRRVLAEAPAARRHGMIAAFLRERLLKALGMSSGHPFDPQTPFGELGLDSLLSVELRNVLGTALETSFPATLLFDHPTLASLTDFIAGSLLERAESAPAPKPPGGLVEDLEALSDDEIDRRLAAKLNKKKAR